MASSSNPQKSHVLCMVMLALCMIAFRADARRGNPSKAAEDLVQYQAINCRKHSALLTDFGTNGDGKTLNTHAFQAAIANLSVLASDSGAQLVIPPGKWLTGSFNLTASHFTLFLHKDAEIIASLEEHDYPILAPLPS